ncbi:MAG: hypothetical protein L0216_05445, partial [Planctomycetales bacterium]|nr:hypothetical protein [Planctomycetales bacterium]
GALASSLAAPERPGGTPFPPYLRAAALAAVLSAGLFALLHEAGGAPGPVFAPAVLLGLLASPVEPPPGDEPGSPPAAWRRGIAWLGLLAVSASAAAILPLAAAADSRLRDAAEGGSGTRLAAEGAVARLPGAGRSPALLALRARALETAHGELLGADPRPGPAAALAPLLDRALGALEEAERLAPGHPGPPAALAGTALRAAESLAALGDPASRGRTDALARSAASAAGRASALVPGNPALPLLEARAQLRLGNLGSAREALARAEARAAAADPWWRPDPDETASLRAALGAAR